MIYDAFMFNNELDLLELRLEHHSQFVDKFIIIESRFTYTGQEKPLNYFQNKDRFKKYQDKIIYLNTVKPKEENQSVWEYEFYQRNQLLTLFDQFTDEDIIIYSDCDEFIRDSKIFDQIKDSEMYHLQMDLMFYYFNLRLKNAGGSEDYHLNSCFQNKWHMAKIIKKNHLSAFQENLYAIREFQIHNPDKTHLVKNAGWHFSNLGDAKRISDKMNAFAHRDEFIQKGYSIDVESIQKRKDQGIDPLGRQGVEYETIDISELPDVIKNNQEKLKDFICTK